eukprot:m.11040 g.11040  ORF g.11040 m.11040 type:complete len:605 (+) comp22914_c0_seq1:49-1863(+)
MYFWSRELTFLTPPFSLMESSSDTDSDSEKLVSSTKHTFAQRRRTLSRLITPSPAVGAFLLLLLVLALERIAWYIVSVNIYIYACYCMLSGDSKAVKAASASDVLFPVISFLLCPVWGFFCDYKFGHCKVLIASLFPYTVGGILVFASSLFLATSATDLQDNPKTVGSVLYFVGIAVMAVSAGGIRAALIPYMLEQLAYHEHQRLRNLEAFVSWAYFAINVGSLVAKVYTGMLGPKFTSQYQDQNYRTHFGQVYIFVPVCLAAALIILLLWRKKFRHYHPQWKQFPSWAIICRTAWWRKKRFRQHYNEDDLPRMQLPTRKQRNERERQDNGIKLGTIVPYVSTMAIFFAVQQECEASFTDQTIRIIDNSTSDWQLWPSILDPCAIIVAVPLMLFVIRPLYERCVKSPLYFQTRMRLGIFLAALSCVSAVLLQSNAGKFLKQVNEIIYYNNSLFYCHACDGSSLTYPLLPQYILLGCAEVLAVVGVMEFVLGRAPREYKTIAFSILQMQEGVGRLLGYAVYRIVNQIQPGWFFQMSSESSDCSQKDVASVWKYYILLAWLAMSSLALFIFADVKHQGYTRKAPISAKERASSFLTDSRSKSPSFR